MKPIKLSKRVPRSDSSCVLMVENGYGGWNCRISLGVTKYYREMLKNGEAVWTHWLPVTLPKEDKDL